MRHVVQVVLAVAAAIGATVAWLQVKSLVDVAPITEGQPATVSVVYDPPMMVLVLVLATGAGVLAVLAVAGVRGRRGRRP